MDLNNCSLPNSFWITASWARFARLNLVLPIYTIVGLFGHIVFLLSIRSKVKIDPSYRYQIFGISAGIFEIFAFNLYILSRSCSGISGDGCVWFMKNFILMWYSTYLAIPFVQTTVSLSLILTLSTAADRVFLLINPAKYQSINRARHQCVALLISLTVSVLTNVRRCFLYELRNNGTVYFMPTNLNFLNTPWAPVLEHLNASVKILCLLALIACNVIIVIKYRKRFKIHPQSSTLDHVEKLRRKREKTLILLTVCESSFFSISASVNVIQYLAVSLVQNFNDCQAYLFAPLQDIVNMITLILDFYAALLISQHFRNMVKSLFPCGKVVSVQIIVRS